jgi:hypothetical protein
MPVIPDPSTPTPTSPGLIWSLLSSPAAEITMPVAPCGKWWLVVPERPDMNIGIDVLSPITSILPGGLRAPASHEYQSDRPQTIHEILGSQVPVITEALVAKSEQLAIYVCFQGMAAYQAFEAIWQRGGTVLAQSDTTRQWYVNLGKTRKVAELQNPDPSFKTLYIVTLDCRQVAPPS